MYDTMITKKHSINKNSAIFMKVGNNYDFIFININIQLYVFRIKTIL